MHRVTLREMEHFVALAEHGSVTGAAAIGLSQPAMSTSLRDLERTLGVTLFVRHRGKGGEPAA
ncbi:MAG: LysR family transcriptional regulator [Actinomycetota bacterium]|nr:LysR family transcriptional regulator [Acidimicrobiales bacterium]MEE3103547.1 LysR family transcriptional regulator [Actinomycetota bacterium]